MWSESRRLVPTTRTSSNDPPSRRPRRSEMWWDLVLISWPRIPGFNPGILFCTHSAESHYSVVEEAFWFWSRPLPTLSMYENGARGRLR